MSGKKFQRVLIALIFFILHWLNASELAAIALLPDQRWHILLCRSGFQCRPLKTQLEPRTFDYRPEDQSLVYIGSDGSLRFKKGKSREQIFRPPGKSAYTQPRFISKPDVFAVVELVNGNSKNTRIRTVDFRGKLQETLLERHATDLDPYFAGNRLFYAHVSCVEGCGRIIQEIWMQTPLGGWSYQKTLTGRLAHQPSYDPRNNRLYFSAYTPRGYRIYTQDLNASGPAQPVGSSLEGSASWPAPDHHGGLFWLLDRRGAPTQLFHLRRSGKIEQISLRGVQILKLRNLKVYP